MTMLSLRAIGLRLAALLLLSAQSLQTVTAADVSDLYVGNVPVADQSESARNAALVHALQQVLVKLSGSPAVLAAPSVLENQNKAAAYAQSYQYLSPTPSTAAVPVSLRLSVRFDTRALDQLLQQAAAPVWSARRPLLLVWTALGDNRERHLLDSNDHPTVIQAAQQAAADRGLPLVLPMMDLDEQTQVSTTDVWGRFHESVQPLGKRYGAEAQLIGRIEKVGQHWEGQWSLLHAALNETVQVRAETPEAAISLAVQQVAERLSARYAVVLNRASSVKQAVTVENVRSLSDYGAVLQMLSGLQPVQQVDVQRLEGERVQFVLHLIADLEALHKAIGLDGRLLPSEEGRADLWRWQPTP